VVRVSSANASYTPASLNTLTQESLNTLIKRLFFHCDSQYAVQVFNEEKKEWEYRRVEEPVTEELIDKHLKGEITLGAYAWSPEGTCTWVCWDFDKVDMDKIRKLCDYLKNRFGRAYLTEASGGRGIHVWLFFANPVPTPVARTIGTTIATKLGLECEVYPASEDGMSLVKLPLGIHRKTGGPSVLIEPESLYEIVPVEVPETLIDTIMQKYQEEKKQEQEPVFLGKGCIAVARICQGVEEGCRNEAGFFLARVLLSALPDSEMAKAALMVWARRCRPPVPEREIDTIVRSAVRGRYSVGYMSLKKHELLGKFCEGCTNEICVKRAEKKKKEKEKELKEILKGTVRTFRRL
jgi:hypothetical protein